MLQGAVWFFIAFNIVKHAIYRPLTTTGVDFPKHWFAPRAILEGVNNYRFPSHWLGPEGVLEGEPGYIPDELWLFYNYPQFNALVTFWMGWFDRRTAEIVWKMLNFGLLIGCWWIFYRYFRPSLDALRSPINRNSAERSAVVSALAGSWGLVSAAILVGFSPAGTTVLFTGNLEPWNLLSIACLFAALLSGFPFVAGCAFAALCLLKMIPVVLLLPFFLWRRWRVLSGWLAFMFGYLLLLIATGRLEYEWYFVTEVAGEVAYEWKWISVSIPQFFLKFFLPAAWNDDPVLYNRFTSAVLVLLLSIYVGIIGILRSRKLPLLRTLEFAVLYVPFLSPLLEGHHLAWTLPVLFLQIRRWTVGELRPGYALAYGLGWIVVALDYFYINMMGNFGEWHKFIVAGGGLLLIVISAIECLMAPKAIELK